DPRRNRRLVRATPGTAQAAAVRGPAGLAAAHAHAPGRQVQAPRRPDAARPRGGLAAAQPVVGAAVLRDGHRSSPGSRVNRPGGNTVSGQPTHPRPPRGTQPDYLFPGYGSTVKRAPARPLILLPHTLTELTGPLFGSDLVQLQDADLTRQHAGEPLGERLVVSGRVLHEAGRPVPHTPVGRRP